MTTEEGSEIPAHNPQHNNLLDWLEDSIPFLPSFLDEPFANSDWWDSNPANLFPIPPAASTAASPVAPANTPEKPSSPIPTAVQSDQLSKRRKRKPTSATEEPETNNNNSSDSSEVNRKLQPNRRTSNKHSGANSNSGSKEIRWAEQLLNPLAAAIESSNLSRVQHLLYVLQELASPTGDANHRLAYHGLHALTRRLSPAFTGGCSDRNPTPPSFATTEPKLFRSSLIKFQEVSPWFAFPNSLANASILQALSLANGQQQRQQQPKNLHIVDIGVSHGIQWPTLLEALTRRFGTPPVVRLTIAGESIPPGPFSSAPQGYDFPSHLLRYAKSIDLNLSISRTAELSPRSVSVDRDRDVLVVCVQFRAQHCEVGDRMSFLRSVRDLGPDLVILAEMEGGGEGSGSGSGSGRGFSRRAEAMWKFLDSTSAAFKGRECGERRVVEGEMGKVLLVAEATEEEGGGAWRDRMVGSGFREEGFGEEATDGGRALLRKYDANWEMRTTGLGVALCWKAHPVSFSSLWRTL